MTIAECWGEAEEAVRAAITRYRAAGLAPGPGQGDLWMSRYITDALREAGLLLRDPAGLDGHEEDR